MDNSIDNRPIGVYDSGIGGLTVLSKLIELMPNEDFIYFADNKNLPYGNKTNEQIIKLSFDIINWLVHKMNVKIVIIACHTSSAILFQHLSDRFNLNIYIIDTITPMIDYMKDIDDNICIIATEATINSKIHQNIFTMHGCKGQFIPIACPKFVSIIESGEFLYDIDNVKQIVKESLQDIYKFDNVKHIIYGCTHYTFIRDIIYDVLNINYKQDINHIDPAEYISLEIMRYYDNNLSYKNSSNNIGNVDFYSSSDIPNILSYNNLLLKKFRKIINHYSII